MDRLPAHFEMWSPRDLGGHGGVRAGIRSRMAEGISRKRARGEHLGPDFKLSPEALRAIVRRYEDGEPMALLADEYRVGRATVYRVLGRARAATS
jgi:DNA invertase Pin-like site-specific DNA recombinase